MTNYPKDGTEFWTVTNDFIISKRTFGKTERALDRILFDFGVFYLSLSDVRDFISAMSATAESLRSAQKERLNKLIEEGKL